MPGRKPLKNRPFVLPFELHARRQKLWELGRLQKIEEKKGDALVRAKLIRRAIEHFKRKPEMAKDKRYCERISRLILNNLAMATDHAIKRAEEFTIGHEAWNQEFAKNLLHYWRLIPDALRREINHQVLTHHPGKKHKD